jgi:hypothetical protein
MVPKMERTFLHPALMVVAFIDVGDGAFGAVSLDSDCGPRYATFQLN